MKLILGTLLFLLNSTASGQKVQGLGFLKVGTTKLAIIDSLKNSGWEIFPLHTQKDISFQTWGNQKAIEVVADTVDKNESPLFAALCSHSKVYLFGKIDIAGIEIRNLYATFFKGTLIRLNVLDNSELHNALESKFGKGAVTTTLERKTCWIGKNDFQTVEKLYHHTWRNNTIKCVITVGYVRASNCDRNIFNHLEITESVGDKAFWACEGLELKKEETKKQRAEKDKLNDL